MFSLIFYCFFNNSLQYGCDMSSLGERSVRIREVEGSNPFRSTKWTLDEHLLFQRRFRCRSSLLMSKQKKRVKVMKPWLSFIVLGILAVFLLLQPFLECRLAFLNVVILSDFRSQMSCKGISRTNTSSTAAQRINLRCFLLCRLFLAIYFL